MDQVAIAVLGAVAGWLSQSRHASRRRWACVFGLLGQPFWFYAAWQGQQWGIFGACLMYSLAWIRGFWIHWIAPQAPSGLGTIQTTPGHER